MLVIFMFTMPDSVSVTRVFLHPAPTCIYTLLKNDLLCDLCVCLQQPSHIIFYLFSVLYISIVIRFRFRYADSRTFLSVLSVAD